MPSSRSARRANSQGESATFKKTSISMHPKTASWLRVPRTWLVTAGAVLYLYHVSAMTPLFVAVVWSAFCAVGMQNGVRRAPPKRWTRRVPRFESILVYTLLCGTLLLPAFVAFLWSGLLVATCVAWIILAASSLMHRILGRILGEVKIPTQLATHGETDPSVTT